MKTLAQLFKLKDNNRSLMKAAILPVLALSLLLYSSCTISLAPQFDQNIADELSAYSVEVFQLFAEVSGGVSKTDFDKRSDEYNSIIGKLEALELQIEARPLPKNKVLDKILAKVNGKLQQKGGTAISSSEVMPSAIAVKNITANISQMKAADEHEGLNMTTVKAFKGNVQLFLDQAVTYESYLNR